MSSRAHRFIAVLLAVLLSGVIDAPREAAAEGELPWDMTEEELKDARWEVDRSDRQPGSLLCGLGAVTVGVVWFGFGHYCVGDKETMWGVIIAEGAGAGLIAIGVALALTTNDDEKIFPVWASLVSLGGMLYLSGLLSDVVGAFKGGAPLSPNQRQLEGVSPQIITRWVPNDPYDINIVLGFDIPWYFELSEDASLYGRLSPKGLFANTFWQIGGDSALLWEFEDGGSYLGVGFESRYEAYQAFDYNVLFMLPYVEVAFNFGLLWEHLERFQVINRLGYGFELYDWENLGRGRFQDTLELLVYEAEWAINLSENSHLGVYYRQRPDLLLGGLATGAGIAGVRLQFFSEPWLIKFEANFGSIAEFWLGIGARFGG